MEESVSGQKVDLEKYIPLRNAYLQASKEIEKLDTEKTFAFVLQNFTVLFLVLIRLQGKCVRRI